MGVPGLLVTYILIIATDRSIATPSLASRVLASVVSVAVHEKSSMIYQVHHHISYTMYDVICRMTSMCLL